MVLKPQDVLVLLKLVALQEKEASFEARVIQMKDRRDALEDQSAGAQEILQKARATEERLAMERSKFEEDKKFWINIQESEKQKLAEQAERFKKHARSMDSYTLFGETNVAEKSKSAVEKYPR